MCGGTNYTLLVGAVVFDSYTTVTCSCAEQDLHENEKDTQESPMNAELGLCCMHQASSSAAVVLEFDVCNRDEK